MKNLFEGTCNNVSVSWQRESQLYHINQALFKKEIKIWSCYQSINGETCLPCRYAAEYLQKDSVFQTVYLSSFK